MKNVFLIAALVLFVINTFSQTDIKTTAEKTNYKLTSSYIDIINFINTLDKQSDILRIETIAKTAEGREVKMMVIANPMIYNFSEAKDDKRVVVYIEANIHAGEVEGKEATQMLARYLISNPGSEILKNCIILINPILNPDGNEKFSDKNRTNQNGPASVGVRYNGQHLDINRDGIKLETPEAKGILNNVLNKWDPSVFVDCHTTNGSYHKEPVTFTWMINPNGDRNLINYMRDKMMPEVHDKLLSKYNVENVFYGEFIDRMNIDKGWHQYAAEPRYLVNYVGIRNRLSILNENYVYADFKTRVNGSYNLLRTILDYASNNSREIKNIIKLADERTIARGLNNKPSDSFAIQYKSYPTPHKIKIQAYEADTIPGMKGYWRYRQSNRQRDVIVDYYADYFPTKSVRFPYAYILDITDANVLQNLKTHGIKYERLSSDMNLEVEQFIFTSLKPSSRINQGHYTNIVEGNFESVERVFKKGTLIVKTAQPLGWLVAYLFEPQTTDGLLYWNYFDKYLAPQWGGNLYPYPVYRLVQKPATAIDDQ
ncbi:MAG: M14 family metallopeptidase [Chlorobi bacterium]|nr:M14 family metallopeptidase [Chlorobiota bacterium]